MNFRSFHTVENMSYKKESWINNRRHYKRHIRNRWMHGHAGRAVDGDSDQSLHSCTILDNFYVEKPIWMVDLGEKRRVSGVVVVTWQGQGQGEKGDIRSILLPWVGVLRRRTSTHHSSLFPGKARYFFSFLSLLSFAVPVVVCWFLLLVVVQSLCLRTANAFECNKMPI